MPLLSLRCGGYCRGARTPGTLPNHDDTSVPHGLGAVLGPGMPGSAGLTDLVEAIR
jgi:hypothetical protein